MGGMKKNFFIVIFGIICFPAFIIASDSSGVKIPKHYFNTCLYNNFYRRPPQKAMKHPSITYSFNQLNSGFYTPLFTKTWENKETLESSNFHLLLTGNILFANPELSNIAKVSTFHKFSMGIRGIYNHKNKNVWFADLSPFAARDRGSRGNGQFRFTGVFLYSRIVNDHLSFKAGIYKTYLFGNNRYLPIIGFRIGKLDKINFQVQFPRNISLNFPIGKKIQGSLFIKNIGGLYTYRKRSLNDSLAVAPPTLVFSRFEALSGALVNYNLNRNFSCFLSSGVSTNSWVGFGKLQKDLDANAKPFRKLNVAPSLFINAGLSIKFGKTRSAYNNIGVYESYDLNKSFDPGDNNMGPAGNQIPNPANKPASKTMGLDDIQDFITADDLN